MLDSSPIPSLDPKKLMTPIPNRSCHPRTMTGWSGTDPEPTRVRLEMSTFARRSSLLSSIHSRAGGATV